MSTFVHHLVQTVVIGVGLKLLTFSLTTILTRLLLPQQSGISFTYTVYFDTVFFISREATRNVVSRLPIRRESETTEKLHTPTDTNGRPNRFDAENIAKLVQISSCAVPLSLLVVLVFEGSGLLLGRASVAPSLLRDRHDNMSSWRITDDHDGAGAAVHLRWYGVASSWVPFFIQSLPELIVMASAMAVTIVEPCVMLAHSLDFIRVVVVVEFSCILTRLLVLLGILHASGGQFSSIWETRLALAAGVAVFAATHVVLFLLATSYCTVARWVGANDDLPEAAALVAAAKSSTAYHGRWHFCFPFSALSIRKSSAEVRRCAALFSSFLRMSLLSAVLSDGERFAMSAAGTELTRGYYQLIYNVGSIITRLLFRVWETACFARWSRDAVLGRYDEAVHLLHFILRLSFYASFTFALIGPPLAEPFVRRLFSARWAVPTVIRGLGFFFYTLPAMGWAGLLESYIRAVATPAVLARMQRYMMVQTGIYVLACFTTLMLPSTLEDEGQGCWILISLSAASFVLRCMIAVYIIVNYTNSPAVTKSIVEDGGAAKGGAVGADDTTATAPASEASVLRVRDVLFIFPPQICATCIVLPVILHSGASPPITLVACVAVLYSSAVIVWDDEVRQLISVPLGRISTQLQQRLRKRRCGKPNFEKTK